MNIYQKVSQIVPGIRDSYTSITSAFEVLHNLEENQRFVIAMQLLNNAEITNGFAKQYYQNREEIERAEFEEYFDAFRDFRNEFIEVVEKQDINTSWLSEKKSRLDEAKENVEVEYEVLTDNHQAIKEHGRTNKFNVEDVQGLVTPPKKN